MPYAIEGLEQTLKALRKFSPDLYKAMIQEVKPELKHIVNAAQSKLPYKIDGLSKFKYYQTKKPTQRSFPIYNVTDARRGITFTVGAQKKNYSGWTNRFVIWNRNPSGAIIETSGRRNPNGRAPAMSRVLKEYGGIQGITYKDRRGTQKGGYVADSKNYNSDNPFAGYHFVKSMDQLNPLVSVGRGRKNRGRIIFAAVEENQGRAKKAIEDAVNKAVKEFMTGRSAA